MNRIITTIQKKGLSKVFQQFIKNERAGAVVLIVCTIASLVVANTAFGPEYQHFWHGYVGGLSVEHWVNDGLMAIFFLLIGLELQRELYVGELSNVKRALLPVFAALGGVVVPALIHFSLNAGTPTQAGVGIPMATDIAFAIGVLALLGNKVPASLKVFLVALAVMDDLAAIIVIAVFYTAELSWSYLGLAIGMFVVLTLIKRMGVKALIPFLIGGAAMWFFMLRSGVHATIAGVLLAFTIPFSTTEDDETSPSHKLEHVLHKPVAFLILPIFALANTGIVIGSDRLSELASSNGLGIILGLVMGKPVGITLAAFIVVTIGICRLPLDLSWRHVFGAGLLGGIGFTMSIFITNLAFPGHTEIINASKMAILASSLTAGILGLVFLKLFGQPTEHDTDMDTMDFEE